MTVHELALAASVLLLVLVAEGLWVRHYYHTRRRVIRKRRLGITVAPLPDGTITGDRSCYCPEDRWERWRDGVIAGPDQRVGTRDDVDLEGKERSSR